MEYPHGVPATVEDEEGPHECDNRDLHGTDLLEPLLEDLYSLPLES